MMVDPQLATAALGLYVIGALAILPFAWGWEDGWRDGEGSGPRFDLGALIAALIWPLLPISALAVLALLPLIFITEMAPRRIATWWNSDWSRP